ncbi:glutamate receptor-like [Centruroides vittatus]|uniref:glutamate receptor-like n=1 Tax=Centruroides vittatus TaxID=120091 RepID=UPI00350F359F
MLKEALNQVQQRLPSARNLFQYLAQLSPNIILNQALRPKFSELPFLNLAQDNLNMIEEQYRKLSFVNWMDEDQFKECGISNEINQHKYVWKIAGIQNRVYMTLDKTGNEIVAGINYKMFKIIQERFNFSYVLMKPIPSIFGMKMKNGSWNGMVGQIVNKEADMAFMPFFTTYDRFRFIDFTKPVMFSRLTFVVRAPAAHSEWSTLIKPFSSEVWMLTVTTVIIIGVILRMVIMADNHLNRTYKRWSTVQIFWYLFSNLTYKGGDLKFIIGLSSRFLAGTWLICVTILLFSYSGELISFETCPHMDWVPMTFSELAKAVKSGEYKCGTVGSSAITKYVIGWKHGSGKLLSEHIRSNRHYFSFDKAMMKVLNERFAYVCTEYTLQKLVEEYGRSNFKISTDIKITFSTSYGLKKGFVYRNDINKIITRVFESGIGMFGDRYNHNFINEENDIHPLNMEELKSVFALLISGYAVSLLCFAVELLLGRFIYHK